MSGKASLFLCVPALVFAIFGFVAFTRSPPLPPPPLPALLVAIANGSVPISSSRTAAIGEITGFSVSSPIVVTIAGISNGTNNMVEVIGGTALSPGAMNFIELTDGRMQYVGNRTVYCHTAITVSISCVSTDQTFVLMLGVNGTLQTNSIVLQHIGNGGDIETAALHSYVRLDPYSYMSLFVGNIISISDFSIYTANGFAMCMDM